MTTLRRLRLPLLTPKALATGVALLFAPVLFAADAIAPTGKIELFNGKDLSGWTKISRAGETPDPATWTVADGVIRCTGMPYGYIRTENRYKNYRLTVEWRWSGPDLPPNAQGRPRNRNSGVLLHTDASDTVWPSALEAQLQQTSAGDFHHMGTVETAEVLAARAKAAAAAGGDAEAAQRAQGVRRVPKTGAPAEKPVGEWNTYEITCSGDTVTLRINGVDQNRATKANVTEGYICLQSEGAPIEFRNVKLTPLE
jgi:hypothetical protein